MSEFSVTVRFLSGSIILAIEKFNTRDDDDVFDEVDVTVDDVSMVIVGLIGCMLAFVSAIIVLKNNNLN